VCSSDLVSHTSDHFAKCEDLARKMLREGKAYMDNTDQETMQAERMTRTESRLRSTPPAENLAIFESLLKGEESAKKYCMRAKIDMTSVNGTMRDPVMYRGNDTPHHRTGTKHKAYPTYDFACPIVDSLEGVTHALRTTEYNDRDEQYHWIQAALGLAHRTQIRAFGKMNFVHTCLSKRKLAWFVENKLVEGWFDPRFPTIQGIMRRGVTIEGLKSFILSQGASRRIITMEWDKFWAENKQVLETTAARYMGVMTPGEVLLTLTNVSDEITAHSTPIMPQFPDKGSRVIRRFNKVFIDHVDALVMNVGEQVTLLRWGNVTIKSIEKSADGTRVVSMTAENNPESTDFKKTKKYTWLAATVRFCPRTHSSCYYPCGSSFVQPAALCLSCRRRFDRRATLGAISARRGPFPPPLPPRRGGIVRALHIQMPRLFLTINSLFSPLPSPISARSGARDDS
jgi:glutamyl/glutaminyl-tRNA synthetase